MLPVALFIAAVAGIAVLVTFLGLGRLIEQREKVQDRLDAFTALSVQEVSSIARASEKQPHPLAQTLNRLISGRAFAASIGADLARANLLLTVPEYVLLNMGSIAALALLTLVLARQAVLAVLAGVVGLFLPGMYLRRRHAARQAAFQQQLADVLTLIVGTLRSGYGMTIAMDAVAKQMPPPAAEEFARVVREIGLGISITQALSNLVRRIRSDDLDLVVTAITIQYEVGGNLATILESITGTIRERIRLKGQLSTLTAQAKTQRTILTGLPMALGAVIYVMAPSYLLGLFTPGLTLAIPIGAVVLMAIGYVVMSKLTNIQL